MILADFLVLSRSQGMHKQTGTSEEAKSRELMTRLDLCNGNLEEKLKVVRSD
jgi:hypothetical protein